MNIVIYNFKNNSFLLVNIYELQLNTFRNLIFIYILRLLGNKTPKILFLHIIHIKIFFNNMI